MEDFFEGRNILKTLSMLMILGAGLYDLFIFINLIGSVMMIATGHGSVMYYISMVLIIGGIAAEMYCGIIGLQHYQEEDKTDKIYKLGIIAGAVNLVAFIFGIVAQGLNALTFFSFFLTLLITGLFLFQMKKRFVKKDKDN